MSVLEQLPIGFQLTTYNKTIMVQVVDESSVKATRIIYLGLPNITGPCTMDFDKNKWIIAFGNISFKGENNCKALIDMHKPECITGNLPDGLYLTDYRRDGLRYLR